MLANFSGALWGDLVLSGLAFVAGFTWGYVVGWRRIALKRKAKKQMGHG
jgi:hypothetical protein